MQQVGPAQSGINFLNMMVANVDESCANMSVYWRDPNLNFLPPANKILGIWGELVSFLCITEERRFDFLTVSYVDIAPSRLY